MSDTKKSKSVREKVVTKNQSRAFRKAAREAGVDPDADIDEVMRRLAAPKKVGETPQKGRSKP